MLFYLLGLLYSHVIAVVSCGVVKMQIQLHAHPCIIKCYEVSSDQRIKQRNGTHGSHDMVDFLRYCCTAR